jgi:Ca2+-transporting ATPase
MTVQELWFNKKVYTVTEVGYEPYGTILDENKKKVIINEEFDLFLSVGVLASNATIHAPDNDHKQRYVIGDPTEGALLTLAGKIGITTNEYTKRYPLVQEFCFDSNRKRMSMVRKHANGMYRIYVK